MCSNAHTLCANFGLNAHTLKQLYYLLVQTSPCGEVWFEIRLKAHGNFFKVHGKIWNHRLIGKFDRFPQLSRFNLVQPHSLDILLGEEGTRSPSEALGTLAGPKAHEGDNVLLSLVQLHWPKRMSFQFVEVDLIVKGARHRWPVEFYFISWNSLLVEVKSESGWFMLFCALWVKAHSALCDLG